MNFQDSHGTYQYLLLCVWAHKCGGANCFPELFGIEGNLTLLMANADAELSSSLCYEHQSPESHCEASFAWTNVVIVFLRHLSQASQWSDISLFTFNMQIQFIPCTKVIHHPFCYFERFSLGQCRRQFSGLSLPCDPTYLQTTEHQGISESTSCYSIQKKRLSIPQLPLNVMQFLKTARQQSYCMDHLGSNKHACGASAVLCIDWIRSKISLCDQGRDRVRLKDLRLHLPMNIRCLSEAGASDPLSGPRGVGENLPYLHLATFQLFLMWLCRQMLCGGC